MNIKIICKESKKGTKYLGMFKCDNDKDVLITTDFNLIKKALGLNSYVIINAKFLEQYSFGDVLKTYDVTEVK